MCNRYLRVLFVQAAWVVLIKPKICGALRAQALASRRPRNDCITMCWRSHAPTSSPVLPGAF